MAENKIVKIRRKCENGTGRNDEYRKTKAETRIVKKMREWYRT